MFSQQGARPIQFRLSFHSLGGFPLWTVSNQVSRDHLVCIIMKEEYNTENSTTFAKLLASNATMPSTELATASNNSPAATAIIVTLLVVISLMSVFGNALLLTAIYINYNLRTTGNFLFGNLALSDFLQGPEESQFPADSWSCSTRTVITLCFAQLQSLFPSFSVEAQTWAFFSSAWRDLSGCDGLFSTTHTWQQQMFLQWSFPLGSL